jgi:hypothetical protein
MRDPDRTDVDLVLKLYDLRREPEMRKARSFILQFMPKSIDDVRAVMSWEHPENAHFRQVTTSWEMVADFAARELLHPEMFAAHCGEGLVLYAKFLPYKDEIRKSMNPRFLANLERAAALPVIAERVKMIQEMLQRMAAMAEQAAAAKQPKAAAKAKRR